MNSLRIFSLAAVMAAIAFAVAAQPRAAAPASGPAASAPRMGMGPGMMGQGASGPMGGHMSGHMGGHMDGGMGMGRMRADADNTPGWAMMTPQEREEHQKKMMEMKSPDECKAHMDKHHEEMMARAKERGVKAPAQTRRDMCAGMK